MKRRDIIKGLSMLPFAGGIAGTVLPFQKLQASPQGAKRDLFNELGIRKFINAAGTYTMMTGSLMHEEVVDAMRAAAEEFCMLDEVEDKVGQRIAALTHAEGAVVTCGCFSAMTLGLAGVLTGMDQKKVEQLPHLEGTDIKSEVIIQKGHDVGYTHALLNTGCKIITIETVEELEIAINEKTAMLWFLHIQSDKGVIQHEEWVTLGKKHGIPTMIDIAADVPPVSNLWKFNDMGFDLVCISGGKAMRGPQSAGLLMGKKDLIAAARLSMPPRGSTIGRGMKVNKEEILGMFVALEKFMAIDHDKIFKTWEKKIQHIEKSVRNIDGVMTEITVPKLGNVTPTLTVSWDIAKIKMTREELQEKLRAGNPSIEVISHKENTIDITAWVMKRGEEKIVAKRLNEVLTG